MNSRSHATLVRDWIADELDELEDVGKLVAYFSSDAASFITGAELVMDGGMSLK